MPDPMVNSKVPKIVLNFDGSIELTVQVVGFAEGKSVEVYGYVTQPTGAFASFRENQVIPAADPATGASEFPVIVPAELVAGQPVTVLTWVSEFWPSMLTAVATSETEKIEAEWAIDQAATDGWHSPAPAGG